MEIIKRGRIPQEQEVEFECNYCKSLLKAKQSEGKVTYDQRDGNFVTFKCPICNYSCHVALSKFK